MAERCPEHRAAAQNLLPSGSQVEHQSQARLPSKCGEQGREPATAATPSASQNTREGKKGGGCSQEKASNIRLRPGLAIAVHLSSERDEIAALSASSAKTARPGLLPTAGLAKEKEKVLVHSVGTKTTHGRKPWSEHKGLPICQIFKQSLNFAAGTYLRADLQKVLRDSAWAGQALLPSYSQEVLLLLLYICKLSCLANTDKVTSIGKAKSI